MLGQGDADASDAMNDILAQVIYQPMHYLAVKKQNENEEFGITRHRTFMVILPCKL